MANALLSELKELIARHIPPNTLVHPAMPGVNLTRSPVPTLPEYYLAGPQMALVAQGGKRVGLNGQNIEYDAGRFVIMSVDLPVVAHVLKATPAQPYLGICLTLPQDLIAELVLDTGAFPKTTETPDPLGVCDLTDDLLDPFIRLLRLLDNPNDLKALRVGIHREILWRLINGEQGARVCHIGMGTTKIAHIGQAISWIRSNYAEALRVEQLAQIAGMSTTSFHRHFLAATSMTPIQYQKHIRLHAARTMLLGGTKDVTQIGLSVGFNSPSQFGRDYRKLFGRPPSQDIPIAA